MSLSREYRIRLTRAEEIALVARMRAGDADARARLIESVIPWMRKLARQFAKHEQQLDDLTQVAVQAMIESLKDFDPQQSRLTTYSYRPACWRMRRWLSDNQSPVSRPQNKSKNDPERWQRAGLVEALPVNLIADVPDPADIASHREQLARLRRAVQQLTPREREILHRRGQGEILQDIGDVLGISKERVRQCEAAAIRNLRQILTPDNERRADHAHNGT